MFDMAAWAWEFAGQAMAVSGAASRQHGVVRERRRRRWRPNYTVVREAHGRCGEEWIARAGRRRRAVMANSGWPLPLVLALLCAGAGVSTDTRTLDLG